MGEERAAQRERERWRGKHEEEWGDRVEEGGKTLKDGEREREKETQPYLTL